MTVFFSRREAATDGWPGRDPIPDFVGRESSGRSQARKGPTVTATQAPFSSRDGNGGPRSQLHDVT